MRPKKTEQENKHGVWLFPILLPVFFSVTQTFSSYSSSICHVVVCEYRLYSWRNSISSVRLATTHRLQEYSWKFAHIQTFIITHLTRWGESLSPPSLPHTHTLEQSPRYIFWFIAEIHLTSKRAYCGYFAKRIKLMQQMHRWIAFFVCCRVPWQSVKHSGILMLVIGQVDQGY